MVSHPELGSDPPIRSDQESGCDIPPGNKPLQCKWIFKRKMTAYCTIDKYKARLVVKGYKQ